MQTAQRDGQTGVVMLGIAQEKAFAWRGWRDGGRDAHPHFTFGRQTGFINHFYWYILDPEWGPSFVKTNAYAPYPTSIYLNGHEWTKRQAARAGIAFEPLDNGFRACDQPERLAAICESLSEQDIFAFCDRWIRNVLPSRTRPRPGPLRLPLLGPADRDVRHPRVLQRGPGAADRDDRQRPLRLRDQADPPAGREFAAFRARHRPGRTSISPSPSPKGTAAGSGR